MNIIKNFKFFYLFLATFFLFSCSKDIHFSGISENSLMQLNENYLTQELTKSDVIEILGAPLVTENSENLWIFRIEKEQGNATFKKVILNKTLKLYFENNILKSVEEIYLN
ncbi:outer membrane protein assembly factor BamE [Alphaproteobacteria bacterium]|nr:outer membrane protein assembly factor BamE [Alphaproteobacteria bacterium]